MEALSRDLRDFVTIHLPPLRHRVEDIPGLVSAFVEEFAVENGQNLRIDPASIIERPVDALFQLSANEWRGRRSVQLKLKDLRPSGAAG